MNNAESVGEFQFEPRVSRQTWAGIGERFQRYITWLVV